MVKSFIIIIVVVVVVVVVVVAGYFSVLFNAIFFLNVPLQCLSSIPIFLSCHLEIKSPRPQILRSAFEFCTRHFFWRTYHEVLPFMSQDVLVVCSSTRWTDEKHMLYLQLLEETFVRQLHESGCSFKGLFNRSPRYCRHMKSSKQIVKYTTPDQV